MSRRRSRRTNCRQVDEPLARLYADGAALAPAARSLESHIETCGPCAARVSTAVRNGAAGPVLDQMRRAVLARATAVPGRVQWSARMMWAAGPALHSAWLVAVVLVVGCSVGLAHGMDLVSGRPLLLVVAPAVPLAGVALSYGRRADPLYEIAASTPSGGLRLLLTRTVAVLLVSIPLLTAAGALIPRSAGSPPMPGATAWLLPGLALTVAALALGSYIGCRPAAGVLACGWLTVAVVPTLPAADPHLLADQLARLVSGSGVQGGWAALAVLCGGLLIARRSSFDHLERV
ncbi:zf-HC2 domain-containing protein [Streptomyces sp. NPDC005963]|uniref:zf-HC2 domain-containing protein n=1 Tax=Streptomyces sp. NPDC005963 TaxID=3156721 RepID=UPI0033F9B3AA